jgi:hypothetical protein
VLRGVLNGREFIKLSEYLVGGSLYVFWCNDTMLARQGVFNCLRKPQSVVLAIPWRVSKGLGDTKD